MRSTFAFLFIPPDDGHSARSGLRLSPLFCRYAERDKLDELVEEWKFSQEDVASHLIDVLKGYVKAGLGERSLSLILHNAPAKLPPSRVLLANHSPFDSPLNIDIQIWKIFCQHGSGPFLQWILPLLPPALWSGSEMAISLVSSNRDTSSFDALYSFTRAQADAIPCLRSIPLCCPLY